MFFQEVVLNLNNENKTKLDERNQITISEQNELEFFFLQNNQFSGPPAICFYDSIRREIDEIGLLQ